MEKTRKNAMILCCSLVMIFTVTFGARFIKYIDIFVFRIVLQVLLNILNVIIAFVAMKRMKMVAKIDLKNKKQYIIGAGVAIALSILIAVIPALLGFSLVGGHTDFSWFAVIYDLLFYMLLIGPAEEFIFRVYLQDVFVSVFNSRKWLGVIIAAFLFGLWHIINGNIIQVFFTFVIGMVFGFSKYKIKNCGYVGVALAHGLYDFLNTIVRMFII